MKTITTIPKDTVVLFSYGEYSDCGIVGLYKALADINPEEVRNEYINKYPEQSARYSFHNDMFINFLKEKKLFEEAPGPKWMEWHSDDYSKNVSEMKVYENPVMFT